MNYDLYDWLHKEGGGFDPWDALDVPCGSYSSEQDDQGIAILEIIASERGVHCTDIAERLGLSPSHVELWQYIFCGADLCDYGTSPRGCFPSDDERVKAFLDNWKQYRKLAWGNDTSDEIAC